MSKLYHYPGANDPETYEWENRIADPEQRIEAFMDSIVPLAGTTLIDVGSGSAYHAWRFAARAARVFAVEPDPPMLAQAFQRLANQPRPNLSLIAADAEEIPLRDGLANIVHARFAYFFGPPNGAVVSCEPGIQEALRLLRPGGAFFVIDNHLTGGHFARLLRYIYQTDLATEQERRDAFWRSRGFQRQTIESSWTAPSRDVLIRVLTMEFPAAHLDAILSKTPGSSLSYHYDIYYRIKSAS